MSYQPTIKQEQSSSFNEVDLLRFMFELNHQSVDTVRLQEMVYDHHMRTQLQYASLTPPPEASRVPIHQSASPIGRSFQSNLMTTSTPGISKININQIPEPKIVFNYVPSTRLPTPEPERIDMTPETTTINEDDESEKDTCESEDENNDKLVYSDKIIEWCGTTIYNNMPDVAMVEYDKLLRESHMMKVEVINQLHAESPINYDYNPNKSRIRTNYGNPAIAEGRTKNNIASRRSRQRKKFQQHILQYSVDYDDDENFLMQKQETWLRAIIQNLENKILKNEKLNGAEEVQKLKQQCGFQ